MQNDRVWTNARACRAAADTARPSDVFPGGAGIGAVLEAPSARTAASRSSGTSSSPPWNAETSLNKRMKIEYHPSANNHFSVLPCLAKATTAAAKYL